MTKLRTLMLSLVLSLGVVEVRAETMSMSFRPPAADELAAFTSKKSTQSALRTRDGLSVVVMSTRVPSDAMIRLEQYADRVFAAATKAHPQVTRSTSPTGYQLMKYPVSSTESVWIVTSVYNNSLSGGPARSNDRSPTCRQSIPEFNTPSTGDIFSEGQTARMTDSVTVGSLEHTRTMEWTAVYRDRDRPNLGFEWQLMSDNCESEEADPSDPPAPPDTPETPNTSYSGGAIGGPDAPYEFGGIAWWHDEWQISCFRVINNVNRDFEVICFAT